MFDVWSGDINLSYLVIAVSFLIVLPLQVLLCFKVKSTFVRVLPSIFFILAGVGFIIMSTAYDGWDSIGYIFLAIYAGFMLFMTALCWMLWWIISFINKKDVKKGEYK